MSNVCGDGMERRTCGTPSVNIKGKDLDRLSSFHVA